MECPILRHVFGEMIGVGGRGCLRGWLVGAWVADNGLEWAFAGRGVGVVCGRKSYTNRSIFGRFRRF